ncbi:MAG TPA: SDR family oxidoreductase [Streptosporangiaceae bacterium]|jgi:nucleoside-diphosphate-sugar epimerase
MTSILLTGATGIVGSQVRRLLGQPGQAVVPVTRREPDGPGTIRWNMGQEPPPPALRRDWDVIIHAAASTRWTMTRAEATAENIEPARAILDLAGDATHVIHVSTAYAGHAGTLAGPFGGYRNGYEWSKARCEELMLAREGPVTIVAPPLILGSRADGAIARFSGPYTLLQALVSGLAAVIVGDPDGYAEIAPVDQVAEVIAAAAAGPARAGRRTEVIAAGPRCLRLHEMVDIILGELNQWRATQRLAPVQPPPTLSLDRWHRFYLPLAREYLSAVQNQTVQLLGMFEAYTSMPAPFAPTCPVQDPAAVLASSVRYWISAKPRLARRTPQPWALVEGRGALAGLRA